MTAVMTEPDTIAVIRSIHDDLELPEGYRAEIIGGQIVVSDSPMGRHAAVLLEIRDAIERVLPKGLRCVENTTLQEPGGSRYIPDIAVWPMSLLRRSTEWIFPAAKCGLAVEVTSPTSHGHDYRKASGYARGGVPVYLVVDLDEQKCMVFSEPAHEQYSNTHTVRFGDPLTLPEPYPAQIDTSIF